MAQETYHLVQAFMAGVGSTLIAEKPMQCKSAVDARRRAEIMAPRKLGIVAYTASGDPDTGDYDETPAILFKAGKVPPQFED